jgi:hypothetical protein
MTVSDSQKVDLLYKKLFGVTKTELPANKSPSNESIASPALNRGDKTWVLASSIPVVAAAVTNIVQSYQTTNKIQCTADTTSTTIGSIYPTWTTGLTNWIPPEFGSTYFIKVYVGATGLSDPSAAGGTQIFDTGSGGTGEWNFDYQAGVLNFIGGTIPAALSSPSLVVYIMGYRYIGTVGLDSVIYTNANVGTYLPNYSGNISANTITAATVTAATVTAATIGNSGTNLIGTINTNSQPYITTVGTLGNLIVSGNITASSGNITASTIYASGNITTSAQYISNKTGVSTDNGGQILLNGATSNRIDFAAVGLGDPNTASRSTGTKIVLYPQIDGSGVDYAIGLTSGVLWNSVHDETKSFKWFANANAVATLSGSGNLTVTNQLIGYHTGAIGANTANTGAFTSITATGNITGYFNGPIGANTANTGTFTSVATTNGGQLTGYLNGPIGANTPNTAAFTSLTITGGLQNTPIGNGTPSTGAFTTLTITGGLQNTPVGNGTPSTGNFTNIISTTSNVGNFYINSNTITVTNTNGNINLTPLGNGIVSINSTTAILMPSGNNTNRPANPTVGMTRYNSVLQGLEVWNGVEWTSAAGYAPSSVIVSDKFTGTGSQVDFTLSQNSTSSGTMVSINGVLQVPDVNYSISGNVLTLVEAPISTDIVEVRSLATLSSITALVVGNSSINFGTPANSYPITVTVGSVAQASFTTANTTIYNNLVTSNGIYWPNGNSYASPPSGINSSLQFNNNQAFGGSTYLTYNSSSGNLVSNSTTKSTSLTTGAVVIGNGLAVGGNLFANALYSDYHFYANGVTITTPAGGANTYMQFNDNGAFNGATYLQYFKTPGNLVSNSTTTSTSTATGAIVVAGGVGIGGNLNVGTNLTVTSNAQIASLGIGTAATGTAGEIRATNNITGYYSSDISLKENVSVITNALAKLGNIRGVEFDWSEKFISENGGEDGYFIRKHDIGVIAQEIEMVLPEVVATRENGIKAVKYDRVVALLIEAIKELQAKVDKLEKGQ